MRAATLGDVLRHMCRMGPVHNARGLTDGHLLERFVAAGDDAAFSVLMHRHGPMVLAVCRRILGDMHATEDALQATFLTLTRRACSIRKKTWVGSWLYGVAQHIAARARAQAMAQTEREKRERRDQPMPAAQPLDELTCQELRSVLDEEIARLPEKYRAAIVLCYFEGKSHEEAAKELGWPKGSLTSRLARARELLRGQLTSRGITVPAVGLAAVLTETTASAAVPALVTINTIKAAEDVPGAHAYGLTIGLSFGW